MPLSHRKGVDEHKVESQCQTDNHLDFGILSNDQIGDSDSASQNSKTNCCGLTKTIMINFVITVVLASFVNFGGNWIILKDKETKYPRNNDQK